MFYKKFGKRFLDLLLSTLAIVILSPVLLVVAILVRIKLGSPVLFHQERPGRNEKIFTLCKFRTMTDKRDEKGNLLPDADRLTKFGKLLRATSMDELPELFNILKGDMSVVGPRPQLVRDMVFMTQRQRKRHSVLPGLTGLAQVNGRNNISWEEKLKWDLQYVNHVSFRADILIIIKTIQKVIQKEDISMEGMETAEDLGDYLLRSGKINLSVYEKKIQEEQNIRR